MFSVYIIAIITLAAATTLFSVKSSCISGKVRSKARNASPHQVQWHGFWWRTDLETNGAFTVSLSSQIFGANLFTTAWFKTGFKCTVDVHLTAPGASHCRSDDDSTVGVHSARHSALSFRGPWSEGLLFSLSILCFILGSVALTAGAEAFYEMLWV